VGRKSTFILQNGGRVKMIDGKVSYAGTVPAGDVFVDSSSLSGQSMKVVSDREVMSTNGVVTVTLVIDSKQNKVLDKPTLLTRGSFDVESNKELVELVQDKVEKAINDYYNSGQKITFGNMKEIIKSEAEGTILEHKKVAPIVVPIILNRKEKENKEG
jgi:ribonuclease J